MNVGDVIRGEYGFELVRFLGGGSFGSVYEAACLEADAGLPERVALKVLHGDLADRHRRHALQRELSALLAVRCARIPRVFDYALDGAAPFIAMQLFEHGALDEHLVTEGALEEDEALRLLESLLEALVAAHNASVLHLDVKPANVLLDGAGGYVLTDFGVAQAPRSGMSLPMPGLGSPGWQSPEQEQRLRGTFDLRTDLFGVGATVWSALTGVNLGSDASLLGRERFKKGKTALPLLSKLRQVTPAVEEVVMSLLVREPEGRPGDAAMALDRVRRLRQGDFSDQPLPGRPLRAGELERLLARVVDPLVAQLFERDTRGVRYLARGESLCEQGDGSLYAFFVIHGSISVVREGVTIAHIDREGEFVGEVAALTGQKRNASLRAATDVWVRVLNAAQLESVIAANPALGVRLIRSMARRL